MKKIFVIFLLFAHCAFAQSPPEARKKLTEMGIPFSVDGWMALTQKNDIKNLELMLKAGADVNWQKNGMSALTVAIFDQNMQLLKFLLDNKANVNARQSDGVTPLVAATAKDNEAMVSLLLQNGADPNKTFEFPYSALAIAVSKRNFNITSMLVKKTANLNIITPPNGLPLLNAAVSFKDRRVFDLLLKSGAPVNYPKFSVLMDAMKLGDYSLAAMLVNSYSANVRFRTGATNSDEESPLRFAIASNKFDFADLLIAKGANPQDELFWSLSSIKKIGYLLKKNVDIEVQNKENLTPFGISFRDKNYEVATLLANSGANVDGTQLPYGMHALCTLNGDSLDETLLISVLKGAKTTNLSCQSQELFHRFFASVLSTKKVDLFVQLITIGVQKGLVDINSHNPRVSCDNFNPLERLLTKANTDFSDAEDYAMIKVMIDQGANPKFACRYQSYLEKGSPIITKDNWYYRSIPLLLRAMQSNRVSPSTNSSNLKSISNESGGLMPSTRAMDVAAGNAPRKIP